MIDITPTPTNGVPAIEKIAPVDNLTMQLPTDAVSLDEELEDELIIEDFTIDGICGVY